MTSAILKIIFFLKIGLAKFVENLLFIKLEAELKYQKDNFRSYFEYFAHIKIIRN